MKRSVEYFICVVLVVSLAGLTLIAPDKSQGSWGVEPTPEVRRAIDAYLACLALHDNRKQISARRLIRASEVETIYEPIVKRNVRAFKAEFTVEYEPEVVFVDGVEHQPYTLVISFDESGIVNCFYEGKGPKEYREAF